MGNWHIHQRLDHTGQHCIPSTVDCRPHQPLDGTCTIDVNECASSPCTNGATCTDSTANYLIPVHTYRCTCAPGFANGYCGYDFVSQYNTECQVLLTDSCCLSVGNCDIDVDECVSAPCKNNGICSDSTDDSEIAVHTFRCTCEPGFANGVCEYDFISEYTSECKVLESDENVECALVGNGILVPCGPNCIPSGAHCNAILDGTCNIEISECASNPCTNGGTCTDSTDDPTIALHAYRCTCTKGFANGVCEYNFIPQYNMQCSILESDQSTSLGGNCDVDVVECASSPCTN
eukprot:COSAG05_NODE_3838_length_1811_cov_3.217290_1_plen_290_part_10